MGVDYVIEMLNITKEFPGILANDNVSLQLKKGEVHALLGENGAGKSTLMSILFGLYKPKSGTIKMNGEKVKYFRVTFEDGQYKSIEKIGGGSIKTELAVNDIEKVQLKDKVLSTVLSILPVVIYVGLLVIFPEGIGIGY